MSGSKPKTDIEQKQFDALLLWLDPDREQAGVKYEEIRHALIKIFAYRGWADSDYLADLTISRVANVVETIANHYEGDPARYFYGVATQIDKMELRRRRHDELNPDQAAEPSVLDSSEPEMGRCLDKCLESLPRQDRNMILAYYGVSKTAKIETRKRLAADLGLSLTSLRIRVHRTRLSLAACVRKCLREPSDLIN